MLFAIALYSKILNKTINYLTNAIYLDMFLLIVTLIYYYCKQNLVTQGTYINIYL